MAGIVCEKCSKEVRPEKRGSLTQWIFDDTSCSCHRSVISEPSAATNNICTKCFNFKSSRRSGSMTQWIFRRYQCKCALEAGPLNRIDETVSTERIYLGTSSNDEPAQEEEFADSDLPFLAERYKPLCYIARSAASIVYKCFDRQLGRLVAIKTLSFPDSAVSIQFQQEARATGLLKHPNIVEVLDFGIGSGGAAYMVLEFVEATNLEDWLQTRGPLTEEETLDLIAGVLRALDFAHRKGIYHRDLKPQNILIGKNWEPKLIDFGLALILSPELNSSDTRGLSLAGTPSYMSPDQFLGRPYDARSEIYSLGCVLFACLTGRAPYNGENALDLANQHAKANIPSLQEARPDRQFSERFEKIIHRCLEKDPKLRYPNVSALANDLQIELRESPDLTEDYHGQDVAHSPSLDGPPEKSAMQTTSVSAKNTLLPLISAALALALVAGSLALTSLSIKKENLADENQNTKSPDYRASLRPISTGTKGGDPIISTFEQKMDTTVERYLVGDRSNQEYPALFREAEQVQQRTNATVAELYSASEKYKACIALRKRKGAVNAPDEIMTRALVGIYGIDLKLSQFEQLAKLEKEIVYYAPDNTAPTISAYQCFRKAGAAYKKLKLFPESLRCFLAANELGKKIKTDESGQDVSLELSIGTTYLTLSELNNAKFWLERTRAHIEKLPPNRTLHVPVLIRLGSVYQQLKDYKTSNQRYHQAERLALNVNDETSQIYLGQVYFGWATTLHLEGRLDEAENKLEKALIVEHNNQSRQAIQSFLGNIRKERRHKNR
jgi:serine/threonine protein kinase